MDRFDWAIVIFEGISISLSIAYLAFLLGWWQ
jgi:hypothetical protein